MTVCYFGFDSADSTILSNTLRSGPTRSKMPRVASAEMGAFTNGTCDHASAMSPVPDCVGCSGWIISGKLLRNTDNERLKERLKATQRSDSLRGKQSSLNIIWNPQRQDSAVTVSLNLCLSARGVQSHCQ